jgi:hypothetical protein
LAEMGCIARAQQIQARRIRRQPLKGEPPEIGPFCLTTGPTPADINRDAAIIPPGTRSPHTCWRLAKTPAQCRGCRTGRREHDDDLYACAEPRRPRGAQPAGPAEGSPPEAPRRRLRIRGAPPCRIGRNGKGCLGLRGIGRSEIGCGRRKVARLGLRRAQTNYLFGFPVCRFAPWGESWGT